MNALLICPGNEMKAPFVPAGEPPVLLPLLGQSLVEYWLSHLARAGASEVVVAASDGPEKVERVVGDGSRWGIQARVCEETSELSVSEALLKHGPALAPNGGQITVTLMNHFPGLAQYPLFYDPSEYMRGLQSWIPQALTPDRVGMHELKPNVWVGVNSNISQTAKLIPPCWVGQSVIVGKEASVGPGAIVEDGTVIESFAEVEESWIGARTYVGEFTIIQRSIAWGNKVTNWQTGAVTEVPDAFVLCGLDHPRQQPALRWLARIAELYRRNKETSLFLDRSHSAIKGAQT